MIRSETFVVLSETSLAYHAEITYNGTDARQERGRADADGDGSINVTEADEYAAGIVASRTGNASTWFYWDGKEIAWSNVTMALAGYVGSASRSTAVSRVVDGRLDMPVTGSPVHSFTVSNNVTDSLWNISIRVPDGWSVGNASGVNVTDQSNQSLNGTLPLGIGQITILPPSPPAVLPPAAAVPTIPSGVIWSLGGATAIMGALTGITLWRARGAVTRALRRERAESAEHKHAYLIEGLLLIYHDGRLLFQSSTNRAGALEDPVLVGSMFTAVSDFIRDSLSPSEELSRLTYGQNTIVVGRGKHLYAAGVIFGEPGDELRDELKETVVRVEHAYAGFIENWDGSTEKLTRMRELVAPLLKLTAGVTRNDVTAAAREQGVRMLSETEYYNGFVRLRLAVVNHTEAPIVEAAINVQFNEGVLRLARIEPATFASQGSTVVLGTVAPGERVGVAYYLDPQTCTDTNIEGSCTYKDGDGVEQTAAMRTRRAEIVCPLFFTREHANPAMLKRLVETSVRVRDSKAFRVERLPEGVTYKDLFSLAVEVVSRHDVQLVREFTTPTPFFGRAWYYGKTKVKGHTVIIRAGAYEERGALEFFVAADSASAITGLLAELNRAFLAAIQRRFPEVRVGLVLDEEAKQALTKAGMSFDDHPVQGAVA